MFLKRLDIIGFKSFAERISIDFNAGVTAVVGPNGSGKSNITDAIRWVLGEQSAKSLRGGTMEDVIFSGSDSRGALNFAEVTLTLDNSDNFLPIDYNEVSVTRRVYRTGESDFFINKQQCRLRDIVDLFMDSGLGRESFSIISQGKVEQILNSKAEERRTIFEEAAGVLKYKNRKLQAEKKLTETEENLNRVNDIVHELEDQIEPLKQQASVANEYLEKKADLEQIEVALTVVEIEKLHEQWASYSKQHTEKTDLEVQLSTTLQLKEAELASTNEKMVKLDNKINELQSQLLLTTEQLEKLAGQKDVLAERNKNTVQNRKQLENDITELKNSITSLYKEKSTLQKKYEQLQNEVSNIEKKLTENESSLDLLNKNIDEQLDKLKSDYFELLSEQANNNNEVKHVEEQLEQLEIRLNKLNKNNEANLSERHSINNAKKTTEQKLNKIAKKITEMLTTYEQKKVELQAELKEKRQSENNYRQVSNKLQQVKSRYDALTEMEDDFAGFFHGVKQVLRVRDKQLSGIYGAIAELIDVPKKYEKAIEIALGSAMQNIVVNNEQNARTAIEYLKQNNFGRATFLPLSIISGRQLPARQLDMIKNEPNFIGVANSLINYDEKFANIIANLLGTVIVTKDLQSANKLARLVNYRYRFVTLDGNVVHPGGSMTGGATKQKTTSLLSRKTELKELKEKITILSTEVAKIETNLQAKSKSVINKETQLESIRQQGEQLRLQEQVVKGDLREIKLSESNINERLSLFDIDYRQIKSERADLNKRKKELQESNEQLKESIATKDKKIAKLTLQKTTEQSSKEKLDSKNKQLHIELNVKKQALLTKKARLKQIKDEITIAEIKVDEIQQHLKKLNENIKSNKTGESTLETEIATKEAQRKKITETIANERERRLHEQQLSADIENELKGLRIKQKELTKEIQEKAVKINRLDVELDNKLAHLREQYSLTFEGAKEQYQLRTSLSEARQEVKQIKLSIEQLGTVNLGAIDEYERVSERYEFLLAQQNDLLNAMDTLLEVISEMDEEMEKRFTETFTEVRKHFEDVFQALFGGGRADLILSDPEDMLHTGVDIVAQPPGKRLQNLALLSGGERALTAIALLFSILKVRPVPFCVLDEVEAALDEANVQRFSDYLKMFSEQTQFIVITHRKGTMEGADILYGVTMQESGVSKLVSVRMEDVEEMA